MDQWAERVVEITVMEQNKEKEQFKRPLGQHQLYYSHYRGLIRITERTSENIREDNNWKYSLAWESKQSSPEIPESPIQDKHAPSKKKKSAKKYINQI